jgi:hypothetical protein
LRTICLGWPWTTVLLIFASWVVGLQVWATGTQPYHSCFRCRWHICDICLCESGLFHLTW